MDQVQVNVAEAAAAAAARDATPRHLAGEHKQAVNDVKARLRSLLSWFGGGGGGCAATSDAANEPAEAVEAVAGGEADGVASAASNVMQSLLLGTDWLASSLRDAGYFYDTLREVLATQT